MKNKTLDAFRKVSAGTQYFSAGDRVAYRVWPDGGALVSRPGTVADVVFVGSQYGYYVKWDDVNYDDTFYVPAMYGAEDLARIV